MIKVGIIGCGRILPNHLHAYKLLMHKGVDVRITAMCDISLDFAKRYWKRLERYPPDVRMGIPITGQMATMKMASTIIRMMLAGIPQTKNSPEENCLPS